MIRAADHVMIVLDDHQRVSLVAQAVQDPIKVSTSRG